MVRPLNELTRTNEPFKWTEQCQNAWTTSKKLSLQAQFQLTLTQKNNITFFTDSSKHSCSGILVQYTEQAREDSIKFKVPHPIIYQTRAFQGSQKNWSLITKEAYVIYMSFCKVLFYLEEADTIIKWDHAPL